MATSNYPSSLDDYSTLPSSGSPITVSSHYFGPAITNIEAELGTDPAGSFTDVKSRLDSGLVEEADQWVITSEFSPTGPSRDYFTAWTRFNTLFSVKGTGLSHSSGEFSFPSTGYYRIIYKIFYSGAAGVSAYNGGDISITTDDFVSESRLSSASNSIGFSTGYAHVTIDQIIRISDIANQKVKFYYEAQNTVTIRTNLDQMRTGFSCIKLGDI